MNLVLAVDSSGSVDDDRFDLQKEGYAKAFLNPRVLNAILENVLAVERWLIRAGMSLPAGGSLLLVASKPA